MSARFFIDLPLQPGALLRLPDAAVRRVQVLRLAPEHPDKKMTHWRGVAATAARSGAN